MQDDGRFDLIRDYARCYIVMKKGHESKIVMVQTALAANHEVKMVRAKNRFEPGYNQSAGYRDYQIILQTKEGWLVEVQIVPEEMLALKEELGHGDYTQFRFVVEAKKRQASSSSGGPKQQQKCIYTSARGKCSKMFVGETLGQLHCDQHTCKKAGCTGQKATKEEFCAAHAGKKTKGGGGGAFEESQETR